MSKLNVTKKTIYNINEPSLEKIVRIATCELGCEDIFIWVTDSVVEVTLYEKSYEIVTNAIIEIFDNMIDGYCELYDVDFEDYELLRNLADEIRDCGILALDENYKCSLILTF